jgi:DUF1680 family protein
MNRFAFLILLVVVSQTLVCGNEPNAVLGLLPVEFENLPLTSIEAKGWLLEQLKIQAAGLSGHIDEFWPDIAQSGWIGGKAEGWERGPYWLDGLIPLAWTLNDKTLKDKADKWMNYILEHQQSDGWLGPVKAKDHKAYDPWPCFVILKAMSQYQEAKGDPRIIPAMQKFLHKLDSVLDKQPLYDWAKPRWGDLVLSIYWLYDRTEEPWLLDLAAKVQTQGQDWRGHFADFKYKEKMDKDKLQYWTHGVNNAMALKQPAVWWRQSQDPADRVAVRDFIKTLDTYHGQATGIYTCDEHYAGLNPSQGTELCTVVEYMFSMETLLSITGGCEYGDRLESIAFNNLPTAFKPDMWAHQFDQQANQVVCSVSKDPIYTCNFGDSGTFGLEPCYGCCTANFHQGWPKFAAHLWMKRGDDGLVAVAYAPSIVRTNIKGAAVQVELQTDYPFSDKLDFTVKADKSVEMSLYLRIPAWTQSPQLIIGNDKPITPAAGTFYRVERLWTGKTNMTLRLPMPVQTPRRYHNSVSINRGPLVYVLKVKDQWKYLKGEKPHADWEVYPTSPWNYALVLDTNQPDNSIKFKSGAVSRNPFTPDSAPIQAKVKGRRIPQWTIETNAAGPLPQSPVDSNEPLEELTLIPYGCSRLRITEFPVLNN